MSIFKYFSCETSTKKFEVRTNGNRTWTKWKMKSQMVWLQKRLSKMGESNECNLFRIRTYDDDNIYIRNKNLIENPAVKIRKTSAI